MGSAEDALAADFTAQRSHLVAVGYRLTSSMADAEDAVQEAWLRLAALEPAVRAKIQDLRAWLTTVVGRICVDKLRSAPARRERYVGQWLPEPVVSCAADPLDVVVHAADLRMALLVVLDMLTPEQRSAFVLHDAFAVPYTDIAQALGCSEAAARQHASRGRRRVADADPPPRSDDAVAQRLIEQLLVALAAADVAAALSVLHPEVTMTGDSGGKARTAVNVVRGNDKVARFLLGLVHKHGISTPRLAHVNGELGLVLPASPGDEEHAAVDARVVAVASRQGRIEAVYDVVNPDKLTRVQF
jgi:RNA polymerase sigma-70 factor (ECF subfamily)